MSRRPFALLAIAAVAIAVACSDSSSGDPTTGPAVSHLSGKPDSAGGGGGGGGGGSGGGGGDTTVHVDTLIGSATPGFHGRVWGLVPISGDTAQLNGIGNVRVELYAGATASGSPEQPVATTTTDAAGLFLIDPVADGVYHARAVPQAGSHYTAATLSSIAIAGDRMTTIREANIILGGTP